MKRKTPLKRTPLRRQSKKRAKENSAYSKRVKEWKLENEWCVACTRIDAYYGIFTPAFLCNTTKHCHHWAGREGALLMKEEWWIPLCATCHSWVHDNSNAARELGLLAPKNM